MRSCNVRAGKDGNGMKTDILIIGGGLLGAATAYFLSREGAEVLLVEQFELNTKASGANAGSIHIQIPHPEFLSQGEEWARNFAPAIPLMLESAKLWAGLGEEIGSDLEVSTTGGLLVAHTEAQIRDISRKAAIERRHGADVSLLSREDVLAIAPYISDDAVGGAFCSQEGKANPLLATHALAAAATRHGATILRNTEVSALEETADGFSATTNAGTIRCKRVVNSAGADAGRIAEMLGLSLPIEGHPIQVTVTERTAPIVPHLVYAASEKLTLKQTRDGTVLIGGGWPALRDETTGRLRLNFQSLRQNLRTAMAVVPALRDINVVRSWPAVVNGTADWKPILGEVPGHSGFFMNMFPWMGFTAGPISAFIVAELILGRKPAFDISHFSALRYA